MNKQVRKITNVTKIDNGNPIDSAQSTFLKFPNKLISNGVLKEILLFSKGICTFLKTEKVISLILKVAQVHL